MEKSRIIRTVVWFLFFSFSIFLLLVIPENFNASQIWITLIFDTIAFVSQLILWNIINNKLVDANKGFFNTPTLCISLAYLIVQTILCVVVAYIHSNISSKVALIINFAIMIFFWIVLLLTIMSRDHVEQIEKRQKNHHTEL